eukprot:2463848-Amphidinium_carterae.1
MGAKVDREPELVPARPATMSMQLTKSRFTIVLEDRAPSRTVETRKALGPRDLRLYFTGLDGQCLGGTMLRHTVLFLSSVRNLRKQSIKWAAIINSCDGICIFDFVCSRELTT